jgi:hypothetical protein
MVMRTGIALSRASNRTDSIFAFDAHHLDLQSFSSPLPE